MLLEQYSPYSIQFLEQTHSEFVFSFKTDNNITYYARFNKAKDFFNEACHQAFNVYDFSFYNLQDPKSSDPRIKATIYRVLEYFINENGHTIIYICDDTDDKSAARNRLFKSWYTSFDTSRYQCFFEKVEVFESDRYVGMIGLLEDIGFDDYIKYLGLI